MSDFLFSSVPNSVDALISCLRDVYWFDAPRVCTYQGPWGSLAVTRNRYNGFQPLETDRHILVIIGGPVLAFVSNTFLTGDNPTAGTQAIYARHCSGALKWDADLSGPFVMLLIDKITHEVQCVTDLMMYIPVYACHGPDAWMLGTHEDALAASAGREEMIDATSAGDFILHDRVTHPYTLYDGIRQLDPATVHRHERCRAGVAASRRERYWAPLEVNPFTTIDDAAASVRDGLSDYLQRVTEGMHAVAQFLSAGEDSRVIGGLLPGTLQRECYIFVDRFNRELSIAQRVADAYGVKLHASMRSPEHYFAVLPEATALIGSGHQYRHAHTAKLSRECDLGRYPAVFGGYGANTLLKGMGARMQHTEGCSLLRPARYLPGEAQSIPVAHPAIMPGILDAIHHRRLEHLRTVQAFRDESVHEWFAIWPASMNYTIGNLYANRRLFRSYEPFLCNAVLKTCSAVPSVWKLRRRLFHAMAKEVLRRTKRIPHADGWYPYCTWRQNLSVHASAIYWRRIKRALGMESGNEGSWADWDVLLSGVEWHALVKRYAVHDAVLASVLTESPRTLLCGPLLTVAQKVSLFQMLYLFHKDSTQCTSVRRFTRLSACS